MIPIEKTSFLKFFLRFFITVIIVSFFICVCNGIISAIRTNNQIDFDFVPLIQKATIVNISDSREFPDINAIGADEYRILTLLLDREVNNVGGWLTMEGSDEEHLFVRYGKLEKHDKTKFLEIIFPKNKTLQVPMKVTIHRG